MKEFNSVVQNNQQTSSYGQPQSYSSEQAHCSLKEVKHDDITMTEIESGDSKLHSLEDQNANKQKKKEEDMKGEKL